MGSERSGKRATETQLAGLESNRQEQARKKQKGKEKFKIKMRRDVGSAGRPVFREELTFGRGKLTLTANGMLAEPKKKLLVASRFFFFLPYDAGAEGNGPSKPSEP